MAGRRRFLLIAAAVSIAVHLAAALFVVYLPRLLPHEARPQEQGTVELLMVEKQGAEPSQAAPRQDTPPQQSPPTQPQPEKTPPRKTTEAPQPNRQPAASSRAPARPSPADEASLPPAQTMPPTDGKADEAKPQEAKTDPSRDAQPPAPPPPPPKAQQAPVFDLAGTESESNAEVLGGRIVPASPDNRFRNRPPAYPYDAAIHGEHGSVLLMIHVSDAGLAIGVDVVESSGVASLDQAASAAVRKWRFRPALREGRAVPFNMPFRFIFEAD
jgi:protein TonB